MPTPRAAARSRERHERADSRGGLIWRHLIGDYSLARSYWLHMVLLGWGLAFAGASLLHALADRSTMQSVAIGVLVFEPIVLLVWLWSVAGTAMSALRAIVSGDSRWWAVLALLTLCSGTLATARGLGPLGNALKEHWAVARGEQPTEGFSVALRDGGRVVAFSGGVNDGAAAAIDKAIGDAPKVGTLLLDSPGGWLKEGSRMADVVRRYGLNTRVEGECFSACTVVLLAGANRSAGEQARIGFHRGRSAGESAEGGAAGREERDLYQRAGLKPAFVQRIVATPNNGIWIPTRNELLREAVLTR